MRAVALDPAVRGTHGLQLCVSFAQDERSAISRLLPFGDWTGGSLTLLCLRIHCIGLSICLLFVNVHDPIIIRLSSEFFYHNSRIHCKGIGGPLHVTSLDD